MKILYHHRIASKDGQFVHVQELNSALIKLGHEIIMVGPIGLEQGDFGSDGRLVSLLKRHVPKHVYELVELSYSVYAYLKLVKAVIRNKPDIIYERYNLFMPAGVWLKKTFRLPMLLEINAPIYAERSKYDGLSLKKLACWTENYTWNNADVVLPVTKVLADIVMNTGVKPDNLKVIPNGIDLDKFNRDLSAEAIRTNMGLTGKFILGFTGFMREWHGLDKIVDLLVDDKNRHLLLVGDGPARESIQRRANELGVDDQVNITGVVPREEISRYIAVFDIALQPDVVEYASPLKLFEYMVLGRAIIAPDTDNIREILKNGENALLFEAGNRKNLKEKIELLIGDEELRSKISHNAREDLFRNNYTWENNAVIITKIANDLVERNSNNPD